MKVPPPIPRIDIEAAKKAIGAGEAVAAFARRSGHSAYSVRRALARAGFKPPRRRSVVRDDIDRRLYLLWRSMLNRCELPSSAQYRNYGARGVRVCKAWHDFAAFRGWARAAGYTPGNGIALRVRMRGYSPSNCSWVSRAKATRVGQLASAAPPARRKRGAQAIDWDRVRKLYVEQRREVADVARELGLSHHGLRRGLQARGWMRERQPSIRELKHGERLYRVWLSMRRRCTSASTNRWLGSAPSWEDFRSFHAWALRSGYRRGLVLTRLDRERERGPKSSAWLTRAEAARFRSPRKAPPKPRWTITAFGETKGPTAWSRDARCEVSLAGLLCRLKSGMPPERAISAPPPNIGTDKVFKGHRTKRQARGEK